MANRIPEDGILKNAPFPACKKSGQDGLDDQTGLRRYGDAGVAIVDARPLRHCSGHLAYARLGSGKRRWSSGKPALRSPAAKRGDAAGLER